MSSSGFIVSPRSKQTIRTIAHSILDSLRLNGRAVPILKVLEFAIGDDEYSFEVLDKADMIARFGEDAEGITSHKENMIGLRTDVYMGASNGNGRDRFTAAHELGHYIMHANEGLALPRRCETSTKTFCDSEWQANQFAREFLVDIRQLHHFQSAAEIAHHFGVSQQVASIQLDEAKKMAPTGTISK